MKQRTHQGGRATRQHGFNFAQAHQPESLADGVRAGRAGGIHDERRPGEFQQLGRNAGNHIAQAAVEAIVRLSAFSREACHIERGTIRLAKLKIVLHERHIQVIDAGTDGDSDIRGGQARPPLPGAIQPGVR